MTNKLSKKPPLFAKGGFLFLLFIVPLILCFVFYIFAIRKPFIEKNNSIFIKLPYYGPKKLNDNDTVYHSISNFELTNQFGKKYSSQQLDNKLYVVNFFTTDMNSVSTKISAQLYKVQTDLKYIKKHFKIISIAMSPTMDSLTLIKDYYKRVHADTLMWDFLTGSKNDIDSLAKNVFLININSNKATSLFSDSTILLIDKEKHIRGVYNGASAKAINRLIDEAKVLNASYSFKNH